jgi:hypothetical protein
MLAKNQLVPRAHPAGIRRVHQFDAEILDLMDSLWHAVWLRHGARQAPRFPVTADILRTRRKLELSPGFEFAQRLQARTDLGETPYIPKLQALAQLSRQRCACLAAVTVKQLAHQRELLRL